MCERKCKQRKELREIITELERVKKPDDKKPGDIQDASPGAEKLRERAKELIIEVKDLALVSLDDLEGSRKRLEFLKDVWGEDDLSTVVAEQPKDLSDKTTQPAPAFSDYVLNKPARDYLADQDREGNESYGM